MILYCLLCVAMYFAELNKYLMTRYIGLSSFVWKAKPWKALPWEAYPGPGRRWVRWVPWIIRVTEGISQVQKVIFQSPRSPSLGRPTPAPGSPGPYIRWIRWIIRVSEWYNRSKAQEGPALGALGRTVGGSAGSVGKSAGSLGESFFLLCGIKST